MAAKALLTSLLTNHSLIQGTRFTTFARPVDVDANRRNFARPDTLAVTRLQNSSWPQRRKINCGGEHGLEPC
jgi:hypothetical protein